jgi:hypothetical protein
MSGFLHLLLALGGLAAAAAVGMMCLVCLMVWFAGTSEKEPSQAWRHADKP